MCKQALFTTWIFYFEIGHSRHVQCLFQSHLGSSRFHWTTIEYRVGTGSIFASRPGPAMTKDSVLDSEDPRTDKPITLTSSNRAQEVCQSHMQQSPLKTTGRLSVTHVTRPHSHKRSQHGKMIPVKTAHAYGRLSLCWSTLSLSRLVTVGCCVCSLCLSMTAARALSTIHFLYYLLRTKL
jgi:hypothetical protein